MLAQAAAAVGGGDTAPSSAFRFESLYLLRPLLLPDGCVRAVQLILRADSQGWEVELASGADGDVELSEQDWTTHLVARGRDLPLKAEPGSALPWDLDAIRASCNQTLSGSEFYSKIWANHGGTGSSFRWIESIWRGDRLALARAVCPTTVTDASSYRLHPGLIEAACQVLHCCGEIETADGLEASGATYVPFSVDTFTLSGARATHDEAWCHARLREMTRENVIADLTILSATGEVVAQLEGFCLRQITREAVTGRTSESVGARMVEPLAGSPERTGSSSMTAEEAGRYLRRKCAELAGYVESEVRLDVGFAALGLDSIAAMRLSNHLLRDLGHTVSLGEILNCRSLVALADRMATQSSHNQNAISDRPPIGR
jgi:aryl carrier-like protein